MLKSGFRRTKKVGPSYYIDINPHKFNDMKEVEIKKIKVFAINTYKILKRRQEKFFEELEQKKRSDDILTVKQVAEEYSISPKTVYRCLDEGLKCLQNGPGGKISIKREDFVNFRKRKSYD